MKNNELLSSVLSEAEELSGEALLLLPEIRRRIESQTNDAYSVLYGFGGMNLHRGWYCPSMILDLVIGNCSRGRLVRRPRSSGYDYRFTFDGSGLLSTVDSFFQGKPAEKEVLFSDGNIVRGFTFSYPDKLLTRFSKEIYDQKMCTSYSTVYFALSQNHPSLYHRETNTVCADQMKSVITDCCPDIHSCDVQHYLFDLAPDCTLLSYDSSEEDHFPSGSPKRDVSAVSRKIDPFLFRKMRERA